MRKVIYIFIFLITSLSALAQVDFNAKVNKTTVQTGEQFLVEFRANTNFSKFEAPSFSHFSVLSGPNQSTSMQYVNGNMTSSKAYSYYLSANTEGTFVIGEAKIEVNGKVYSTKPIEIKVVKGQAQTQSNSGNNNRKQQNNQTIQTDEENLFMRIHVNKTKGVVGDQFIATYKLYTRVDLSGIIGSEEPKNVGFWKEDVKLPERTTFTQENVNGKQYNTAIIKQTILIPQKSGKLTIDPLSVTFRVRMQDQSRGNSLFDQFFGRYVEKDVVIKSNSVPVTIENIPSNGKPVNYSGGVGNFSFSAKPDKLNLKNNEAFNLVLIVKGSGNIKLLEMPNVDFPSDFEVYDPKNSESISASANGITGKRTSEYLIIPRHSGNFIIPEIKFSYFDTQSNSYKTITEGPFEIVVEKGENEEESSSAYIPNSKEDVKLLGKDIRYIHTNTSFHKKGVYFFGSLPYFISLCTPFILLIFLRFIKNKVDDSSQNTLANRSKKATKIATKKLATAKKHLQNNEKDQFYEEVINSINGYFEDKFNINKASISKDIIAQKIAQIGIDKNISDDLISIIDKCEMARFAPITDTTPEGIYETTLELIIKIEEKAK